MSFIVTLSQTLTLRAFIFNSPDPLSKGAIRASGLSIAAGPSLLACSGPASDDALLILRSVLFRHVVRLLPQTTTMCAAFTSSMYLLSQRRQNRLFCLCHWIHVCKYGLSAHVMQFLKGHGGRSGLFAPFRPSLILSRTAAQTAARARSAQGLRNSPRAMPLFGAPHCPIAFSSQKVCVSE